MPRGLFIALDGLDGTGKSTQCRLLAEWLRGEGHRVTQCADPGGTPTGDIIRGLLLGHRHEISLNCEALLFMASRAQLVTEVIGPALAAGQTVVADRFLLANVVYQGHAGGIDPAVLWRIGDFATGGLEPDRTFILDLPLETALARRTRPADRMESREADFYVRVRNGFLVEADRHADRLRVIDASPPLPLVHERIRMEVADVLAERSRP